MKTKILSVLLACLMVLSVFPVAVFAEEAHVHATCAVGKGNAHNLTNCPDAEFVKTVPGLCGEQGYTLYQCPDCGDYFAADFSDPEFVEHALEKVEGYAATCYEEGRKDYWHCTNCNHYFADAAATKDLGETEPTDAVVIGKLYGGNHNFVELRRDGDCVTPGKIYYGCTSCDATKVEDDTVVPGSGHVWSQHPTSIVTPPNGCTDGVAEYTCTVCNITKKVVIVSDNHQTTKYDRVEPTCTSTGNIEYYYCSICRGYFSDAACTTRVQMSQIVLPKLSHDWQITSTDPGSCSEPPITYYTCGNCGATKEEKGTEAAHAYGDPLYREPTCTTWGASLLVCQVCGFNKTVEKIEPLGHMTYDEAKAAGRVTIIRQPSCTTPGLATWTCGRTGCTETHVFDTETNSTDLSKEDMKATGHSIVVVDPATGAAGKVPTCKEDGYKFSYCENANCDEHALVSDALYNGKLYDVTVNGNAVHFVENSIVILPKNADLVNGYHDWDVETLNASTCVYKGQKIEYCTICAEHKTTELPLVDHTWDAGVEELVQDMTCHQDKIVKITYTCTVCGETDVDTVTTPTNVHNMVAGTYVPASCVTKVGYTPYTCSLCGEVRYEYNQNDVAPEATYEFNSVEDAKEWHEGFVESSKTPYVPGDCHNKGLYKYECTTCDKYVLVVIEGTGHHEADDGIYDTTVGEIAPQAPTCTVDGWEATYKCSICGELVEVDEDENGTTVLPAAHNYGTLIQGTAATCTTDGEINHYQCSACSKYFDADKNEVTTIVIPALGHSWTGVEEVPADCENDGLTAHQVCSVCGATDGTETVIPALGHTWDNVAEVAPTCYSTGVAAHKLCSVCGKTDGNDDELAKVPHALEVKQTRAADCLLYGYTYMVCKYCKGDVNQDKIFGDKDIAAEKIILFEAAKGHNAVTDARVEPTCLATGLTEGSHCADCGEILVAQETLEKVAHNNGTEDIVNDCMDTVENRVCQWCHQTIAKECQVHFELTVAPSCFEDGYVLKVCVACQKSSVKEVILAPNAHTPAAAVVENNVNATCTAEGSYDSVVYCSVCGEELSRTEVVVDALGHDEPEDADYVTVEEPTYLESGLAVAFCENGCGKKYEKTLDPLAGVVYELSVDNAIVSGANYADSSLVAVKVSLNSIKLDVQSVMIDVVYDASVVTFEGYEFLSTDFVAVQTCSNNGGFVTLYAQTNNTLDGKLQNTTIEGEQDFAVLYFRIDNKTATAATFSVANGSTVEYVEGQLGGKAHSDDETAVETIAIGQFMDLTGDKTINNQDAMALYQIITGELGLTYDARADIDKSGVIDYHDLELLAAYMTSQTEENYENMVDARPLTDA